MISVPLSVVWVATRVAGCLLRNKKKWVYSCYDKLASDLVFDPQTRLPRARNASQCEAGGLQGTSGQVTRIRKI